MLVYQRVNVMKKNHQKLLFCQTFFCQKHQVLGSGRHGIIELPCPFLIKKLPENESVLPQTNVSLDFKELQDSVRAAEVTLRAEAKRSIGSLANGVRDNIWMAQLGIIWNWSQPKSTALSFFVWFYMVFMFSWNLNQGILYWNKLKTINHDIFESLLFWCDFRRKKQRFLASRKC